MSKIITVKHVSIIINIFFVCLIIFLLIGGSGKNRKNQNIINQLKTENGRLTTDNNNFETTIKRQGEIITRLENTTGKLQDARKGISEDFEELEKLIFEIFGD